MINKVYWLILMFFISANAFSQEQLEGEFCASVDAGFIGICLNFEPNNRFEYSEGGCLETIRGKGTYKLKEKNLWLYFDKIAPQKKQSTLTIEKLNVVNNGVDSITLYLNVVSKENGDEIPSIIIKKKENKGYKELDCKGSWGKFRVKLPRDKKTTTFEIGYIGYEKEEFEIDQYFSYKINLILTLQPSIIFISDTVYHYSLTEVNKKYFNVKNNDNLHIKFEKK